MGASRGCMRETRARLSGCWTTYVGAAHGVLQAAGLCELDITQMMGMTGMAFHLIVHERCEPASVTVYDWLSEHLMAFDRIGVLSEIHLAEPGTPTYDAARRRAVENIRASIDRGIGVVLWGVDTGEFGVVYGYDDGDGVFLVNGVHALGSGHSDPILYENVGRSFPHAPFLHYQMALERVPFDPGFSYRRSLEFYVHQMEKEFHMAPGFKSGLMAYENWSHGLDSGAYHPFGLRYLTAVYHEAKIHAARYLAFLAESWRGFPSLPEIAAGFDQVAGVYQRMMAVLEQDCHGAGAHLGKPVSRQQAEALIPLVKQARGLEERSLQLVKRALAAG